MSSVASLRQIRRRIRSVENTKKITRAMEMVAAAKLRRFQDFLESARPYTEKLEELLGRLIPENRADYSHPFLTPHPSLSPKGERAGVRGKTALILFTSDTGLCGTYNSDLETLAGEWARENSERKIYWVFVGKHGAGALRRRDEEILGSFSDLRVGRVDEALEGLGGVLTKAFLDSKVDEIHAVYTRMESLARYQRVTEKILPIAKKASGSGGPDDFILEPNQKTILDKLIPNFFEARLRFIFYHALLTEQIARMSAMRQATQNAEEMVDELTLLRNKARQAAITKEIIEVVSGSRALKLK